MPPSALALDPAIPPRRSFAGATKPVPPSITSHGSTSSSDHQGIAVDDEQIGALARGDRSRVVQPESPPSRRVAIEIASPGVSPSSVMNASSRIRCCAR